MRVEIESASVDSTYESVTKEFQREARIPGFRPGKAPLELITRTYAKQIDDEVKRKLIGENYRKAIQQQKLNVVGEIDIEEIQFGRGQSLQFAATVETSPEFELPEYKGLPVRRPPGVVSEEDIDRALGILREQRVTYIDVARPVQMGDFVVVNYSGTSEGKPLTEFSATAKGLTAQSNFWIQIKAGSFIPGFSDQLIGANAGEHRTVTVEFPLDFVAPQLSGKQGVYEVDIVRVKEAVYPAINDDFAKALGADNVEKLREGVRRDLQNELDYTIHRDTRNQLVRGLLSRVNFELPESIVLSETRNVIYDIVSENQKRGVSKEAIDKQKDEIYNIAATGAKDRIKISFLLKRIAEKEGITVNEKELLERLVHLAMQNNIKPEKFIKQLKERNGIPEIHDQLLGSKALDFLEQHAQIEEVPATSAPAGGI